jgi:chromosome segregation ATPase
MTEHDRKQRVLEAEEAILQLADQLALARQSRTAADEVAGNLQATQAALEGTRASLRETLLALQENTQRSSSALAEARDHLEKAQRQVGQACHELHALTQHVGEITPTLQRYLEKALAEIANAVRLGGQGQERLREDICSVRRLTWVLLLLSLLAFGVALTSALFLALRPG